MGRPTSYTPDLGDLICERIAGGESLRAICLAESMPNRSTVFRWLAADEKFRDQYAHARDAQAEGYAEEIVEIADTCRIGTKTKETEDGGIETTTGDMVERSRLQIDARKWVASKLLPQKYGDKMDVTSKGESIAQVIVNL